MTKIIRVLVPVDSQEPEAFGLALAYAEQISKAAEVEDVILLVHTKHQLDGTGLSRFLGAGAVKAMNKGTAALSWGGRLHGETIKTLRYPARKSVVIAYYSDEKLLDFADGLNNVIGVVAVPWVPGEADGWAARWNTHVHGRAQQAPERLIDDPVVVSALETLTTVINPSTGLGHPRDKAMANEILRILRAKGHADPSATIKSWAIRRGWRPDHAADLEAFSRKIWSLKTKPSLSAFHDPHGRYARWKSDE
jgi:hypothetical protein